MTVAHAADAWKASDALVKDIWMSTVAAIERKISLVGRKQSISRSRNLLERHLDGRFIAT